MCSIYGHYHVMLQTINLAKEKSNFRLFWIDMQRGYFSLLLENYPPQVYPDQKYVYSSLVKRLSSQEQVVDHLKYAFKQVCIIIIYMHCIYMYSQIQ